MKKFNEYGRKFGNFPLYKNLTENKKKHTIKSQIKIHSLKQSQQTMVSLSRTMPRSPPSSIAILLLIAAISLNHPGAEAWSNNTPRRAWLPPAAAATVAAVGVHAALAVSGGGLDFAGLDISGQDFSKGNYKGKDFTQVLAKATNFRGSNLQGCRFYKA